MREKKLNIIYDMMRCDFMRIYVMDMTNCLWCCWLFISNSQAQKHKKIARKYMVLGSANQNEYNGLQNLAEIFLLKILVKLVLWKLCCEICPHTDTHTHHNISTALHHPIEIHFECWTKKNPRQKYAIKKH